jgi:ParB family chromosome partitioning protein
MGGIDLDPATCPAAQAMIQAGAYYTVDDSGLLHSWTGRVWLNPPFSMPLIARFVGKLVEHYQAGDVTQAVLLVDAATDTRWFHVALDAAAAICFHRGRVRFLTPAGRAGSPTRGQALFYFGPHPKRFARYFRRFGKVILLQRLTSSTAVCEHCRRQFQPTRWHSRYCSAGCKQAAYRARKTVEGVTDLSVTNGGQTT